MKFILIILLSSISLSLFAQTASIPKGGSADTIYNKKNLPVKIKIFKADGTKDGTVKLSYYENDTLKTYYHVASNGKKHTTEYNSLGLPQISQTRYRDDISQTVFVYQYDSLDNVTRVRAVRNNQSLIISEAYTYEGDRVMTKQIFDSNDSLAETIYYYYKEDGSFDFEAWGKNGTIRNAKKMISILPDSDTVEYILTYWYSEGRLWKILAIPYQSVNETDISRDRETISFQWENGELVSYTYFDRVQDENGHFKDREEGLVFEVNDSTENHPMVIECNSVMEKINR